MTKKTKIECSYQYQMKPSVDYGQFIAEVGSAGKIKVDSELYYKYVEARRAFEILDDEMFRELPIKVKRAVMDLYQKGSRLRELKK